MLASIELRVPLLDERVFAAGLLSSSTSLIKGKTLKVPMKEMLRSLLPRKYVERPKTGFNPPLDGLIFSLGKDFILKELSALKTILSIDAIAKVVSDHFEGQ